MSEVLLRAIIREIIAEDKDMNEANSRFKTSLAIIGMLMGMGMSRANAQDPYVRCAIASNPNTPVKVLIALSKDADASVRRDVAANPSTPANVLAALMRDEVARDAAQDRLSNDKYSRLQTAKDPETSDDVLTTLSHDIDPDVRKEVAKNPETPNDVLATLLKDKNKDVRQGVAENTETPDELLATLARDNNADVRADVAKNTGSPLDVLDSLARDESTQVRNNVAHNTRTDDSTLLKLTNDDDFYIRTFAGDKFKRKHPHIDIKVLYRDVEARFRAQGLRF